MSRTTAYLDYNATAPIEPAAIDAMTRAAKAWGNPSSVHADGRHARAMLEDARGRIAAGLGCGASELVFTSGGTEALGMALRGAGRVVASAVEHDAVRRCLVAPHLKGRGWGWGPTTRSEPPDRPRPNPSPKGKGRIAPVDHHGVVDLSALEGLIQPNTLIAVMHANNETGVIQPIPEVVTLAREHGARTLVDAVQSAGKLPLPDADLVAISAHKLGGPPGVGALIVRDFDALQAMGGQERGYRAGTENLPAIMGFAAAVEARAEQSWLARVAMLRDRLEARLTAAGATINGAGAARLPTTSSIRMPGVPAETQVIAFDLAGFRVSAGAACSSGKVATSHVLIAMGVEGPGEAVRVSLGWNTTQAEVDAFADAWQALAARRAAA